jgi:hypothetical protein
MEGAAEEKKLRQKKVPKENKTIRAVIATLPELPFKMSRLLLHEDMEVRLCAAAVLVLCVRDSATVLLLNTRMCFRNLCETLGTCLGEHKKQAAVRREAARLEARKNNIKKKKTAADKAGARDTLEQLLLAVAVVVAVVVISQEQWCPTHRAFATATRRGTHTT